MKIALVAQHATPLRPRAGSGPESDDIGLSELTRKLADHGHKVTIYAQKQQPDVPDRAELGDGVRVEHIDAGPVPEPPADGKQDDSGLLDRVPAFSGPLRSSWEQERPDIVHALRWTSGLAALAAARDHHIPVVQEFSSLGVTEPRGLVRADGAGRRADQARARHRAQRRRGGRHPLRRSVGPGQPGRAPVLDQGRPVGRRHQHVHPGRPGGAAERPAEAADRRRPARAGGAGDAAAGPDPGPERRAHGRGRPRRQPAARRARTPAWPSSPPRSASRIA